ncbi:MAG: NAD-dependent epimerase/dehydratase family protein [Pseudomonadales bacterium]
MDICITGGAGLVGQNLVQLLIERGYSHIAVLDKSANNLNILKQLHANIESIHVDLSIEGAWQERLAKADVVISLQAQIGGLDEHQFLANNVVASRHICDALKGTPNCYLVHISSSVLDSQAADFYTQTKAEQEDIFADLPQQKVILRPTLMFGWFDRKHLGWLSRFMAMSPLFPVPGHGRYLRQPLYARDFCRVIIASIEQRKQGGPYSISGKEKITYIDMIKCIRAVAGHCCIILKLPYVVFYLLLKTYALFDKNPPFTISQLEALVIDELFAETDWETEFSVKATPFKEAIAETFTDPKFADVVLEF